MATRGTRRWLSMDIEAENRRAPRPKMQAFVTSGQRGTKSNKAMQALHGGLCRKA